MPLIVSFEDMVTPSYRVRSLAVVDQTIAGVKARYGEYDVDGQHHSLVIASTENGAEAVLQVRSADENAPTDYILSVRESGLRNGCKAREAERACEVEPCLALLC